MSNKKTLREKCRNLILESTKKEMNKETFMKMVSEEWDILEGELLEQRIGRNVEEKEFRKKAIKAFNSLREFEYLIEVGKGFIESMPLPMFLTKKREKTCLEILCVYYTIGIENMEEVYSEVERRLQVKSSTIKNYEKELYRSLARYYSYDEKIFMKNEEVRRETLKDFINVIQEE